MGFNRLMVWLLRSPLHGLASASVLALQIVGLRSGRVYNVPVNYVKSDGYGENRYLITSKRDRTWWRNLRERVEIQIILRGQDMKAHAQAVEANESVMQGLAAYFEANPKAARYFDIAFNQNGQVPLTELARLAEERVIIWVEPLDHTAGI